MLVQAATVAPDRSAGGPFFFEDPKRIQCLNFLIHLAPYSNQALLVVGPAGSGKTALLKRFAEQATENSKPCFVSASAISSHDLAEVLVACYGAAEQTAHAIIKAWQQFSQRGIRPIIIVDDLHKAEEEVFQFILSLIQKMSGPETPATFIFSVRPEFLAGERCGQLGGTHQFALEPLDLLETKRFVTEYLAYANSTVWRPNDADVARWHEQSRGVIGALQTTLDERIMQELALPASRIAISSKAELNDYKLPLSRYVAALSLLALFVVVIIVETEFGTRLFSVTGRSTPRDADTLQAALAPDGRSGETAESEVVVAGNTGDDAPALPVGGNDESGITSAATSPRGSAGLVGGAAGVSTHSAETVPEPADSGVVDQPAGESLVGEHGGDLETDAGAAAEPPQVSPAGDKTSTAAVSPVKDASTGPQGAPRDSAWLLAQDPASYTLQLIILSKIESIDRLLKNLRDKSEFAVYPLRRDGGKLFAVVYGIFPDRKAAKAAQDHLPGKLVGVSPWVRRMSEVHAEIRKSEGPG